MYLYAIKYKYLNDTKSSSFNLVQWDNNKCFTHPTTYPPMYLHEGLNSLKCWNYTKSINPKQSKPFIWKWSFCSNLVFPTSLQYVRPKLFCPTIHSYILMYIHKYFASVVFFSSWRLFGLKPDQKAVVEKRWERERERIIATIPEGNCVYLRWNGRMTPQNRIYKIHIQRAVYIKYIKVFTYVNSNSRNLALLLTYFLAYKLK